MDPSALIFIALAVAWAVYLIPKALEHHEESVRTRTVEKFSATVRVLARREPVSRRRARLVRADSKKAAKRVSAPPPRRSAAAVAARRRLRVVALIAVAIVTVAVLTALHVLAWWSVVIPVGVLVVWLVACRVMVKSERRAARPTQVAVTRRTAPVTAEAVRDPDETGAIPVVAEPAAETAVDDSRPDPTDPGSWDPVPVTLPTYVSKAAAPRSVRTIDLDSTGVWTSGRQESDSELVRESQARASEQRDAARGTRRRA